MTDMWLYSTVTQDVITQLQQYVFCNEGQSHSFLLNFFKLKHVQKGKYPLREYTHKTEENQDSTII